MAKSTQKKQAAKKQKGNVKKSAKPVSKKKVVKIKTAPKKKNKPVPKKTKSKPAAKAKIVSKKVISKKAVTPKTVKPKKTATKQTKKPATKAAVAKPSTKVANKQPLPIVKPVNPVVKSVKAKPSQSGIEKTRYSDKELQEFKEIILKKLDDAKVELQYLQGILNSANDHGTDDTANTFKVLEDGSETLAKEEAGQLASRQQKFIEQLENALIRIENKTYGICRVTGKLIPKERLKAVPHTTQSMEAKMKQYNE